jgi:diamine N-acetyltransferase
MNTNFQIRLATESDAVAIKEISESTFVDTYSMYNSPENMQQHILQNFSLEKIISELQTPHNQYVIVNFEAEIIAFAKLVKGHFPENITEKLCVEIERFYVKKEFHGQNLGRYLMDFCVNWAIGNTFEIIWLGVWENNPNAIKFYEKMGFSIFGSHNFVLGTEPQNDFLMKRDL